MVDIAIMSSPKGISFDEFIKLNPQLMEGGLFLQYYKKETMLNNPTARKEFVLPDIFSLFFFFCLCFLLSLFYSLTLFTYKTPSKHCRKKINTSHYIIFVFLPIK